MHTTELKSVTKQVSKPISEKLLMLALVSIITLGTLFRVTNIGHKVYWTDEVFTSLQVSGHSMKEVDRILDGKVITNQDINRYQFPHPEDKKSFLDTINGLIVLEPQHTPIYFVSARFWLEMFGNSITTIRSLGVLWSLLSIPLMYWLCMELFNQTSAAWIGATLVAISPFHLLYAHEARPTVMWIAFTIFSCAALLRARRVNTVASWTIYSMSLILSLYTFLFSGLTIAAHFVYVAIPDRLKVNRANLAYGIATLVALLSFIPWMNFLLIKRPSNFASYPLDNLLGYPKAWVRSLSLIFADFNINEDNSKAQIFIFMVIILLILVIVIHAFYCLLRQQHLKSIFVMISSLILVPSLILLLHDIVTQGSVTSRASYFVPSIIGIQLLVSYWVYEQFLSSSRRSWLLKGMAIALMTVSVFSCGTLIQSDNWWLKANDNVYKQLAVIINQSDQPLVVSDAFFIKTFSLSHELKPETRYSLMVEPVHRDRWSLPKVASGHNDVFLFQPSEKLLSGMSKKFAVKNVIKDVLWKIEKA